VLKLTVYLVMPTAIWLGCSGKNSSNKFSEYLIQNRTMHQRIHDERVLGDSLAELDRKYSVDFDEELSHLNDNPELWIELLKELKSGH
jgi:hypothetical protein